MSLNRAQIDALLQPINPHRVRVKKDSRGKEQSHVEAYDIRRRLNNIFGFGGWGEKSTTELIYENFDGVTVGKDDPRPGVEVGYKGTCTLTVYGIAEDGKDAVYTEEAFGGQKMGVNSRGDCHDFAIKTASSQALKRAATNLGDQYGLSLYNKGSKEPLVVYVLGADPAMVTKDYDGRAFRVVRPEGDTPQQTADHVTEQLAAEEDAAPEDPEAPVSGGAESDPMTDSPPAQDKPAAKKATAKKAAETPAEDVVTPESIRDKAYAAVEKHQVTRLMVDMARHGYSAALVYDQEDKAIPLNDLLNQRLRELKAAS